MEKMRPRKKLPSVADLERRQNEFIGQAMERGQSPEEALAGWQKKMRKKFAPKVDLPRPVTH